MLQHYRMKLYWESNRRFIFHLLSMNDSIQNDHLVGFERTTMSKIKPIYNTYNTKKIKWINVSLKWPKKKSTKN